VAVAVIRDNVRPAVQSSDAMPADYNELMTSCWHADPSIRPTFLEVMTRLSSISGEALGGSSLTRTSTSSSSHNISAGLNSGSLSYPSISAATSSSGGRGDSSSSGSRSGVAAVAAAGGPIKPPEGEVVIVFSDVTRAASLWEFNAEAMRDATLLHNELVRRMVKKHGGYEVVFLRDRNSGEGSFCLAFSDIGAALDWCGDTQRELLAVEWPEALLEHPGAAEEWGDTDDRVMFKGLRVRMGVHAGTPKMVRDPMTRRVEYIGPVVNAAARITALAHGGQVLVSEAAQRKMGLKSLDGGDAGEQATKKFVALGRFEMPDAPKGSSHSSPSSPTTVLHPLTSASLLQAPGSTS
jgi:class 3 adenylate cyclase